MRALEMTLPCCNKARCMSANTSQIRTGHAGKLLIAGDNAGPATLPKPFLIDVDFLDYALYNMGL